MVGMDGDCGGEVKLKKKTILLAKRRQPLLTP